jgi:hypothetical protein
VSDQPYTVYLIALNKGARSHATQPTDLIHATASWEMVEGQAGTSQESRIQADLPLVISPDGGAAVIPLPLAAPATPGAYRLAIHEQDGPLGSWQVEAVVEVGEGQDDAFPAPAQLLAWTVPEKARANEPVAVELTWRALGKIDAYYSVYVKLLDNQGNAIASWDGQPQDGDAPTLLWAPGATIEDRVSLLVPAGTPAGEYTVEAGMYRADDLARVLTLDVDGIPLERVVLGALQIEP